MLSIIIAYFRPSIFIDSFGIDWMHSQTKYCMVRQVNHHARKHRTKIHRRELLWKIRMCSIGWVNEDWALRITIVSNIRREVKALNGTIHQQQQQKEKKRKRKKEEESNQKCCVCSSAQWFELEWHCSVWMNGISDKSQVQTYLTGIICNPLLLIYRHMFKESFSLTYGYYIKDS